MSVVMFPASMVKLKDAVALSPRSLSFAKTISVASTPNVTFHHSLTDNVGLVFAEKLL